MSTDPLENVPLENDALLPNLLWSQKFNKDHEYLTAPDKDAAHNLFKDNLAARQTVLLNPAYANNKIVGVLYGAMLKKILNGGTDFKQKGSIVALMFKWRAVDNQILLDCVPVNSQAASVGRRVFSPPEDLFSLLGSDKTLIMPLAIKAKSLLIALGFPSHNLPTDGNVDVLLQPIIVDIDPKDIDPNNNLPKGPYFALATSVSIDADNPAKPYAYGPPCPPVCYG